MRVSCARVRVGACEVVALIGAGGMGEAAANAAEVRK